MMLDKSNVPFCASWAKTFKKVKQPLEKILFIDLWKGQLNCFLHLMFIIIPHKVFIWITSVITSHRVPLTSKTHLKSQLEGVGGHGFYPLWYTELN